MVPSPVYRRSSGPFSPVASSSTGYAEVTPDATARATGWTHGGGLGEGVGVATTEGVGWAATPGGLLQATAKATTRTSQVDTTLSSRHRRRGDESLRAGWWRGG